MAYLNKQNNGLCFYIYTRSEIIELFVRFQTERHVRNRSVFKKIEWEKEGGFEAHFLEDNWRLEINDGYTKFNTYAYIESEIREGSHRIERALC